MVGNAFRVARENHKWIEQTYQIRSDLGKFGNRKIEITLFKDEITELIKGKPQTRFFNKSEFTTTSEAIFLTVNGQTHHTIGRSILKTKANLKNLTDYLMIHIDVSNLEAEANEIFHGSREQVRRNKIYCDFEERLLSDLKDNPYLRSWDEEYRKRKLSRAQPDMHFVKQTAAKILSRNPEWVRRLDLGKGIGISVSEGEKPAPFKGSYIPTFFKLKGDSTRKIPVNNKYSWIYFETDASNDYLMRDKDKGEFIVLASPEVEKSFWLREGLISLKIITPRDARTGDSIDIEVMLTRPDDEPLKKKLKVILKEARKKIKGGSGKREASKIEYNLPELDRVEKNRWGEFHWGGKDISMADGSVIRINIDSYDVHDFIRRLEKRFDPKIIMKAYETAIYLYTLKG